MKCSKERGTIGRVSAVWWCGGAYLDGGDVVSDDDKLGLLGLDQVGDVVQTILDNNGLGAELLLGELTLGGSLQPNKGLSEST
jgi:hypothetical protein